MVRHTEAGVSQMKMAPSEPAVTMNFWLGEMAIYNARTDKGLRNCTTLLNNELDVKKERPYLSDLARVANTLEVVDSFIVVPKFDHFVVSRRDKVLALIEDGESVELT